MHVLQRLWKGDALLSKSEFDLFGQVRSYIPVIICLDPGADNEIHTGGAQFNNSSGKKDWHYLQVRYKFSPIFNATKIECSFFKETTHNSRMLL